MVVDIADPRAQPFVVEGLRAAKADLFLGREEELDAAVGTVLGDDPPRRLEHHRDGRLVVGAEDRAARVPDDAVLDHGLDRTLRRNRVKVGAEEQGRSLAARLDPGEQVADRRVDPGTRVVLVDRQCERAQIVDHPVGDCTLLPGRARHTCELEEELGDLGQPVLHGPDLICG